MIQLSASTLKLFQECPRCFWLHINQRLERPRGPFPSLPSGIDRVLKGYFDLYRQQGALPPLMQGRLEGTLATSALTLGFNDRDTRARLWGKLDDCLVLPDTRLAPLDHKTRASAPDGVGYTEKYYKFQMDVYTLLLERNGYPTSRTAYVVYYFPVDGALHRGFPFDVAVHRITTHPETAHEIFAAGCRCLAGPLPDPGAQCEFCRWIELRARHAATALPAVALPAAPCARPAPAPASAAPRIVRTPSVRRPRMATRPDDAFPHDLFG